MTEFPKLKKSDLISTKVKKKTKVILAGIFDISLRALSNNCQILRVYVHISWLVLRAHRKRAFILVYRVIYRIAESGNLHNTTYDTRYAVQERIG